MKKVWIVANLLLMTGCLLAQNVSVSQILSYRQEHEKTWLNEYLSFLSIPNIATVPSDIQRNTSRIMEMMKARSIDQVQLLFPRTPDAPPAVYGEVVIPGATQSIIFYAHYDGQPFDSTQWAKGFHPFHPKIIQDNTVSSDNLIPRSTLNNGKIDPEWRIVARGASDDKAGVLAILYAYEALRAKSIHPAYNIKFFFEGEEEKGSPHLQEILERYQNQLRSDLWIICDGPVHQSGKKLVSFGVRGDAGMEITVYGSKRPLHSGHYGNWAPNPALQLSKLLASMKDDDGKVLVKGFYDKVLPLNEAEKNALEKVPVVDDQMKQELGFHSPETKGLSLLNALLLPSLNINGMSSAGVGKYASNIIPAVATANLDLRLVPGTDYQEQQELVEAHIRKEGFFITRTDPTDAERARYPKIAKVTREKGYNAQRTSMELPIAQKVIAAVQATTSDTVILMPSLGGSLPLYLFEKYLSAKTITVPIANHDNNQHAENENIRLQNFWDGIETMASLMMMHL